MAKGWIDRVFVNGLAYEYPGYEPWTGPLGHVRAMAVFTSSYERAEFEPGGRVGSVESVLHPLLWGTFAYCGMQVLEPFIAYAADSVDRPTREGYLEQLRTRLESLA
jgi:NAD(P)H dehydrogenase (quinone)